MPEAQRACVSRKKCRDYMLSPDHELGCHKARLYASIFGYTREDWEHLREQLIGAAPYGVVTGKRIAAHQAVHWSVDLTITGPNGQTGVVHSRWRVAGAGKVPWLTSAWPKTRDR